MSIIPDNRHAALIAVVVAAAPALTDAQIQTLRWLVLPVAPLDTLPVCGAPAAQRIEVYSPRDGRAHGDLDASLYVCAAHAEPVRAALSGAGYTPYTVPRTAPGAKRCGDGMDFSGTTPRVLSAPAARPLSGHQLELAERVRRIVAATGQDVVDVLTFIDHGASQADVTAVEHHLTGGAS